MNARNSDETIRRATDADLEAMLDLSEARRSRYAAYHPRFHKPAPHARDAQRPFFSKLISAENFLVLVHQTDRRIDGFLTGQLVPPPPVYDPGGLTCVVDDFALERQNDWPTVGYELLAELRKRARDRGAAQIVVVSAPEDEEKGRMLDEAGMTVVSERRVSNA
jgi:hypothetical protein